MVGTDVRRRLPEDIRRRTAGDKLLEHLPAARVPDPGVQLAVRKGAGAALAELNVGSGVQPPGTAERLYLFLTGIHILAALEQNRMQPGFGQHQRSKQPGRAAADDHRRVFRLNGHAGKDERLGPIQAHLWIAAAPYRRLLVAG